MNYERNFWFFKPLCTRGSLITQFTNFDVETTLQYIFTSNKMLVIHKWSRKYANKPSIIKHVLRVSNDTIPMWLNRLTLHQDNGKNLSTKEAIVVSQDCPKLLRSPETCGSQRVNEGDIDHVFESICITIRHTKISRTRFRLDYWFSHRSYC